MQSNPVIGCSHFCRVISPVTFTNVSFTLLLHLFYIVQGVKRVFIITRSCARTVSNGSAHRSQCA